VSFSIFFIDNALDDVGGMCLRYGVSGYPTLKFFPKENKDGESYDGGRSVDDFVSFINARAGTNRDSKGQLTGEVRTSYLKMRWIHVCVRAYCVYVCMSEYTCVFTSIYILIYIYVCMYVCM
jgi:hypothetical protein